MSTISEKITLSVQMGEPGTIWIILAFDLTFLRSVGESVMGNYIVFR